MSVTRGISTRHGQVDDGWWAATAVLTVLAATVLLGFEHGRSWYYFADAADLVSVPTTDGGGLAMYRRHPEFQFGPPAVALAWLVGRLPGWLEVWTVMVFGSLTGVVVLRAILRRSSAFVSRDLAGWMVPVVTVGFLSLWLRLAAYSTHIDDVAALSLAVGVGIASDRRRPFVAGALIGLAAAFKPWAVVFFPLVLITGPGKRVRAFAIAGVVAAVWWLPFVLQPGTIEALRSFRIDVDPNSGIHALGLLDATTPPWLRAVQLALAGGAATAAALRLRRWPPVLLTGVAARLLIDPATHHYYTAGLGVAGLAWELDRWPARLPWRTATVAAVLELAAFDVHLAGFMPAIRFAAILSIAGCALSRRPGEEEHHADGDTSPLVAAFSAASDSPS